MVVLFWTNALGQSEAPIYPKIDQKERSEGQKDAQRDLKKGLVNYVIVGAPSSIDQELKKIAKEQYGITVIFHGCCLGPHIDYDQGYSDTVMAYLKGKYKTDPVVDLEKSLRK